MIAAVFCVFLCASCANLVSVLPAHTCRKQGRKRSLRNVPAVVLAAVIATLADHAVRQWRAPARQAPPPWPGVDPADPQHAQELHALHHEPSDEFCAAGPPLVCAHGGDTSGGAPANSLEAFQAALQRGVPCLEVDVARTSDGRLVVLHPRDLAQLLRHAGQPSEASDAGEAADEQQLPQVGDYSWEQLAALSWPGGQRVGAAEEVLQLAVPAAQHITLDVKTHTGQVGWSPEWIGWRNLMSDGAAGPARWRMGRVPAAVLLAHNQLEGAWLCQQDTPTHPCVPARNALQGGEDDLEAIASAVVDLIGRTACGQCLVWAKSDALVSCQVGCR